MKNIKILKGSYSTMMYKWSVSTRMILAVILSLSPHAVVADSGNKEAQEKPARTIAAKVNDQPIYRDQLEKRIRGSMKQVRSFGLNKKDQALVTRATLEQALNEEIAAELFYQGGLKLDLPDAAKKISEAAARIKASLTDEQKKIYSGDDIRAHVARRFYINQYMAFHDLINPQVPEEEVRAFYERTKQGYISKEIAVNVRHILVNWDKDASEDEDGQQKARKKIEQARKLILGGKDFAEVAKEFSEDKSAYYGGHLGYIKHGYMPPEFDKAAFSLKPGETSEIVETKHGYHLLKVMDIRPEGTIKKYESLRAFFTKYLSGELKIKKTPAHAKQIREKAKIEIFLLDEQEEEKSSEST